MRPDAQTATFNQKSPAPLIPPPAHEQNAPGALDWMNSEFGLTALLSAKRPSRKLQLCCIDKLSMYEAKQFNRHGQLVVQLLANYHWRTTDALPTSSLRNILLLGVAKKETRE